MKTKRKLLLTFLIASFVLIAVVATVAITFAMQQQTIKTTLNISYAVDDIDGTVRATYTIGEETKNLTPQADADHISADGKSLIFKATDLVNAGSLEFPEDLDFTSEKDNVIIQYNYTNTGDKHYTATMSFDAELKYENMVVEYGIWDSNMDDVKYSRNRYALVVPAGKKLSYWVKISIKDKARNASFEGDFNWLLEGCDKETLGYESLDVIELESTGTEGAYTVSVSNIQKENFNGNIVFPAEVNGESVTTIVESSLSDADKSKVQSVYIPSSVSTISENAFKGFSDLEEVTFEQNESAGSASVQNNTGLTTIGTSAFANCSILDNFIIPSTVTTIGATAFISCLKLSEIDIPNSVTSVGTEAFSKCNELKSVTIGNGVVSLGGEVFSYDPSLQTISVDSNNATYYSENNAIITKSDKVLISGCSGSVTIPSGVVEIADKAFYGSIADGGSYIVTIPNTVKRLGKHSFYNCTSISNVVFEENSTLQTLDEGVFMIKNSNTTIPKLQTIAFPDSVTTIGKNVFANHKSLKIVNLGNGVKTVGSGAFKTSTALEEVILNSTITSGTGIFKGLNLKKVTIGPNVTDIGQEMFASNSELDVIDLSNATSLKTIGNNAFYNVGTKVSDRIMETLSIPEGVTSIGNTAFYGTGVTKVELPSTLETIGNRGFYYAKVETIEFAENNKLTTLSQEVFAGCSNLSSINLSNLKALETIGVSAFHSCSSLSNIVIPQSVTSINKNAFAGTNLTSATFEDTTTWTAGSTAISEEILENVVNAAKYLNKTYNGVVWTKA